MKLEKSKKLKAHCSLSDKQNQKMIDEDSSWPTFITENKMEKFQWKSYIWNIGTFCQINIHIIRCWRISINSSIFKHIGNTSRHFFEWIIWIMGYVLFDNNRTHHICTGELRMLNKWSRFWYMIINSYRKILLFTIQFIYWSFRCLNGLVFCNINKDLK